MTAPAPGLAALEHVRTTLVPELLAAFPGVAEELPTPFEIPQVRVTPEAVRGVAEWLKARGFNMLLDLGGVDYYPHRQGQDRFEVVYHFLALPQLWKLRVRVPVGGQKPEVPSLSDLWPNANPAEREAWDQFGIRFRGHQNLTRILNPDDWEGHPLRKDYPLRGPRAMGPYLPADLNRFHPFKDEPAHEG